MSSETLHFNKAPIVEAIIGLDLEEMLGDDSLVALKGLGQRLLNSYPTCEDLRMSQFELTIGSQPKQMDTQIGYFFKSMDGLNVIHARRNGFAFSRLAPYQNWDVFLAEAKRSWTLYREVIGPIKLENGRFVISTSCLGQKAREWKTICGSTLAFQKIFPR